MDVTGPAIVTNDAKRDRAIQILNILLDSIQDNAVTCNELPRLGDEEISLTSSCLGVESKICYLFISFCNNQTSTVREENFVLDPVILGAVFAKLMTPNWSRVYDDNNSGINERRLSMYEKFDFAISSTASNKAYHQLYLDNLEAIIKFSCSTNACVSIYTVIFDLIESKKMLLTSQRKAQVLDCISQECHKLIAIHQQDPKCRENVSNTLRAMYISFLKLSQADRKILFPVGQRLRAYLYQNHMMGPVQLAEDDNNAFIYHPKTVEEAVAILSSEIYGFEYYGEAAHALESNCVEFGEGYVISNIPGAESQLYYVTVNDTKFPENFLGICGLERSITNDIECWKKLLLRDYSQHPYSPTKSSSLRTVIACLAPLRAGAEDELKQFILSCSLHETLVIYETVFAPTTVASNPEDLRTSQENKDFLVESFKQTPLLQQCLDSVTTGSDNVRDDARRLINIMYHAIKRRNKNDPILSRLVVIPVDGDIAPHSEDEQESSQPIWKILAFMIAVVSVLCFIYSKRNPFRALGGSKSIAPRLADSALIS